MPPRPRPHRKVKGSKNLKEMPKTIQAMGMNVQRGVLLAGYGIFPCNYLSLFHNFKDPEHNEDKVNNSNKEYNIYRFFKGITWIVVVLSIMIVLFH